MERMDIRTVPITVINPAPYNPRKNLKPNDPDYEALRRSIDRWGLVEPLVWNERTGNLVGGHQRLKILKDKKAKEVEVSVVDLDANDEAALNVALNKIEGGWDMKLLADLLSELDANGYDATLTGFDVKELEDVLGIVPGFEPTSEDEQGRLDEKKPIICPECSHEFQA